MLSNPLAIARPCFEAYVTNRTQRDLRLIRRLSGLRRRSG